MLETLLVAAGSEDEMVSELLRASLRCDQQGMVKLARAIAERRGISHENSSPPNFSHDATLQVRYEDRLLAAIQREEMLLDMLVAASVQGERPKLFRLCRELTTNRKRFDREFRREVNTKKEPEL